MNSNRRKFIISSVGVASAIVLPTNANAKKQNYKYNGGLVTNIKKPLPYKSIPGFLSKEQLSPHYIGHYGGALKRYVSIDKKLQSNISSGKKIDTSAYASLQRSRTNKANSVMLHELYFEGMSAKSGAPSKEFVNAIKKRFGSMERWAYDFQTSAKTASGWAMLAFHPLSGKLYNVVSDKHATGVFWMGVPLIVIDTYEHSFYVDYKNKKAKYISKFMNHINWEESSLRFKLRYY